MLLFWFSWIEYKTLNSSVIILVFQQILKGMNWILCFSAGTTGKKEAANHFRWSSLSSLASILNVGFCWWIELQKCHRMNRWTSEENSMVNSQVLIMLVKEPPRLVSRCGPLNNQPTSRNMPWFATSSTTGFEAGVLSTTSSVWIIAAKIFFWFVFLFGRGAKLMTFCRTKVFTATVGVRHVQQSAESCRAPLTGNTQG